MNYSSNPAFRMFENLHSITLEMKLFLFHQILYSISKAFFLLLLAKIYSQKNGELFTFWTTWKMCPVTSAKSAVKKNCWHSNFYDFFVERNHSSRNLACGSFAWPFYLFCITVSTQCLVPINNDFLSINNHSSTHTLLGLFDT